LTLAQILAGGGLETWLLAGLAPPVPHKRRSPKVNKGGSPKVDIGYGSNVIGEGNGSNVIVMDDASHERPPRTAPRAKGRLATTYAAQV